MKKMLTMAVVLAASLLSLCACSSTDPPADPGEAPLQSWYKTDTYTLLLPQGFTAQEGEDGGVTLSLDGQAVGGVQVVPYPNAAGFLDTVGAASEDSRDSGKELMRQLSPEERLAYMMTVSEDGTLDPPTTLTDYDQAAVLACLSRYQEQRTLEKADGQEEDAGRFTMVLDVNGETKQLVLGEECYSYGADGWKYRIQNGNRLQQDLGKLLNLPVSA